MKVAVPFVETFSVLLVTMSSAILLSPKDTVAPGKMRGKGIVRARKGVILVISNKEFDDIFGIKKNSGVLIDGSSEAIKMEIKRKEGGLFAFLGTLGVALLGSMLIGKKVKFGEGEIKRLGYGYLTMLAPLATA